MIDNLTFEIIKRIIADVGVIPNLDVSADSKLNRGLASSGLLLHKTLSVRYEDGTEYEHDIYSGKLEIEDSILKGLLVNLSIKDTDEFIFVFRFNTLPIHAIRVIYNSQEDSFIRIRSNNTEKWVVPSVYMIARLLSEFEQFVSWGHIWNECKDINDLYDVVVKLVD